MPGKIVRALIVDDSSADAELLALQLSAGGYEPITRRVQTAADMTRALTSEPWDVVLCDYTMPQFDALGALTLLKKLEMDLPFIIISGSIGEEIAVKAMKAGAHDYFMKGNLGLLVSAIERELREADLRKRHKEQREILYQNEKLAAMGTLLAGVAHELNNPLSVLLGQATLLQRDLAKDGSPREERAEKILQAGDRCARIVRNFLAIARQQAPERTRVHPNNMVREAMELVSYGLRADDIEVDQDLGVELPVLWADAHQLQQIVINLVTNAQHALRARPTPRTIRIATSLDPDTGGVFLRVADNGNGIPQEAQARIFEPFFTTKPAGQGTGLGLSLCRSILTAHGGWIQLESTPGAGATFIVLLPMGAPPDAKPENQRDSAEASVSAQRKILLVDDEPEVARVVADMLTTQGHDVRTAASGASALLLLAQETFDVVITDMRMPDLDGPSLFREASAHYPHLRKRFIFLTGDTLSPGTDEFLSCSDAPYLEKPFLFDELARTVDGLFN